MGDNKRKAEKIERDRLMKEKKVSFYVIQEQDALKREQQKKTPGGGKTPLGGDGKGNEKIMDGLYSALDSGAAFQKRNPQKPIDKSKKKLPDEVLTERRRTMNINSRELMSQMLKQSKDLNPEASKDNEL